MKRRLLVAAMAAITSMGAFAQGYYYIKKTGTTSEYNMNSTSGTNILTGATGGVSNTLSGSQTLPFSWNFYGSPVTTFKVSSSGYVTFNASQTADNTTNVALPSTSAPRSAIFAFWGNIKLEPVTQGSNTFPSDVRTWTYGNSPSRVFVIQWRLAGTVGSSAGTNVTYFAIRLYEGGAFDIVENYGFGTFSATIGAQDSSGTHGTMIGSNMNFGGNNGSYVAASSDVYQFIYGTQPVVQAKSIANKTAAIASTNISAGTPIAVQYTNYGSAGITTATLNYTINGGAKVSEAVTGTIAANGGLGVLATNLQNYKPVTADEGTTKTVMAWLSGVNGGATSSDTITFSIFVNKGITGTKRVLLEEGSGAWCGYCPDGHLIMRDIIAANGDKVIGTVHHNSDGMATSDDNTINSTFCLSQFNLGYPYGMIDRTMFADQPTVGMNRGSWSAEVSSQVNAKTPVNVSIINRTFDPTTGIVAYDVKVDFVDYVMNSANLRINTFIVEDKVRGPEVSATSTTWNQHNYYSSQDPSGGAGGASHELYNQPNYFYGYMHNHVAVSVNLGSGTWGNVYSMFTSPNPATPTPGYSYTKHFTYTLPTAVSVADADFPGQTHLGTIYQNTYAGTARNKPNETSIIAFVGYYNSADITQCQILNSVELPVTHALGVQQVAKSNPASISSVTPNPTSGYTRVDFNLTAKSNVSVEVLNVVGQKVLSIAQGAYAEGDHTVTFDAATLNNGIYFVTVKTDDGSATHKIVVSGN
jgi:hypothetical protein